MRERSFAGGVLAAGALTTALWVMTRVGRSSTPVEPRRKETTRRSRRLMRRGGTVVSALPANAGWNRLLREARGWFGSDDRGLVAVGAGIAAGVWLAWFVPGVLLAALVGWLANVPSPSWAEVFLGAASLFIALAGFGWFGLRALVSRRGGPSQIGVLDDVVVIGLAILLSWLSRPPL